MIHINIESFNPQWNSIGISGWFPTSMLTLGYPAGAVHPRLGWFGGNFHVTKMTRWFVIVDYGHMDISIDDSLIYD